MDVFDTIGSTKKQDVFDRIESSQGGNVFDELSPAQDIFDEVAGQDVFDTLEADARAGSQAALNALDVAMAPYRLDWSDQRAERELHIAQRIGDPRWVPNGDDWRLVEDTSSPSVGAIPKRLREIEDIEARAAFGDPSVANVDMAAVREEAQQLGREYVELERERQVRGFIPPKPTHAPPRPASLLEQFMSGPSTFIERSGLNALPMAGALTAARAFTIPNAVGRQALVPLVAATAGGTIAGGLQEEALAAMETPEQTEARRQRTQTLGQTAGGKLADLATMSIIARPSATELTSALRGDPAALRSMAFGAGAGGGMAAGSIALEGRMPTPGEIIRGIGEGAIFNTPTRLGRSLLGIQNTMRPLSQAEARIVATAGIDALPTQTNAIQEQGPSQSVLRAEETQPQQQMELQPMGEGDALAQVAPETATETVGTRRLGPGAANIEEFGPQTRIGMFNDAVDAQRMERGLEPLMSEARLSNEAVWDAAVSRIEANPELPRVVADEINAGTRKAVNPEDQAILGWEMVNLRNQRDAAAVRANDPSLSEAEQAEQLSLFNAAEQRLQLTEQADRKFGTEWGRTGQFRQRLINDDFTLANVEARARVAKGAPLTPQEVQDVTKISDTVQRTQQGLDEIEGVGAAIKAAEQATTPAYDSRVLAWAEKVVTGWEKAADGAWTRLRSVFKGQGGIDPSGETPLLSGLDTSILDDVVLIARAKIGRGVLKFGNFVDEMVRQAGEAIRPYLQPAWDAAQAQIDNLGSEVPKAVREKVKQAVKKGDLASERDAAAERMKASAAEGGTLPEMRGEIQKLVETLVRGGVKQRDALITAVHDVLREIDPNITRRQTMDAISGYGAFKPLNPDQVKAEVRDLKGQMQQVAKLEDLEARQPLQKTGVERRTPSDEERRLIQAVNDAKKKYGVVVTDPTKQLKSALDSIETRLKNQIKDITRQIETGESPRQRTPAPTNDRIEELRALRDRVRSTLESLRPKEGLTDAQRAQIAKRNLEASIADLQRRIRAGDTSRRQRPEPIRNAELDALRAQREALRTQMDELRALENPKATPEEIALKTLKTRMANRTADLQARMAAEDFEPRKRKPVDISKDPEAVRLKAENENAKKEFAKKKFEWEQERRTLAEKVKDTVGDVLATPRSLLSSGDVSAPLRQGGFLLMGDLVFNPKRAARQIGSMFKQLVSEKAFDEAQASILLRPNAPLYESSKLYLADLNTKLTAREEHMRGTLAEKIPVIGRLVRSSNRAYVGFLNRQRADAFDAAIEALGGRDAVTPEGARLIADSINTFTGRGSALGAEQAANFLAKFFFSPRYQMSRLQTAIGQPLWQGLSQKNKLIAERKWIAQQYGKAALAISGLIGLAAWGLDGDVELDPRSSDFGKLRFGNTRLDFMAGLQQMYRIMSQTATGEIKTLSGEVKPISAATYGNFLRGKLAPVPGEALNLRTGKNVVGEEVTPMSALINSVTPLGWQDTPTIFREHGVLGGSVMQGLNLLGAPAQNIQPRE